MKKTFVVFALLCTPAFALAAPVSGDYIDATDSAATSTFNGAFSLDGQLKMGTGNGILSSIGGYVQSLGKMIYDNSTGFLGVGTTTQYRPGELWEFASETNSSTLVVTDYNNSTFAAVTLRGARGTQATPAALLSGNTLGQFGFSGYDGSSFLVSSSAAIRTIADGNWSGTSHGTDMIFMVTPNGSTVRSEKMRLTADGHLNVGTSTVWSSNALDVDGGMSVIGGINLPRDNSGLYINQGNLLVGSVLFPYNSYKLSVESGPTYMASLSIASSTASLSGALSTYNLYVDGDGLIHGSLGVSQTGTSRLTIDSDTAGGCLIMKDSDGVGYTYITANDGVLSASTTPC